MKKSAKPAPKRLNVVPDRLDLRDRLYLPAVGRAPPATLPPPIGIPVLDQKQSNACTGFSLSTVLYGLAYRRDCMPPEKVSPWMLYSMARRYDEFPGQVDEDAGSSLRGAMKGWYKHGACKFDLWRSIHMPAASNDPATDWWLDAAMRPLGAYYRVDARSVTDMQIALLETGVLYASAVCHKGWQDGFDLAPGNKPWLIPPQKAAPDDGGHAFAIVGYDSDGFIIHNSWGRGWGREGQAVLSYDDWLANAMDCWVAQLGVVSRRQVELANAASLPQKGGRVQLSPDTRERNRLIAPFVVDMGNNGTLSNTGDFRTNPDDLAALVGHHAGEARRRWGLADGDVMDVAIYAHGGLTSEGDAAETAAVWIKALYDAKIFPIFLMWETDFWSTIKGRATDAFSGQDRPAGGLGDQMRHWWNKRLESLLSVPGTAIWGEMKQNGRAISEARNSGGQQLYRAALASPHFARNKVRIHLIGHSAGSIVHSWLAGKLCDLGWRFENLLFMAPAVTLDTFSNTALPHLKAGRIGHLHCFNLSDVAEQSDPTCKPILGYSRSLLYLVSESFEHGKRTPLLGMQKYWEQLFATPTTKATQWLSPGRGGNSSTHGGFDDDAATLKKVIQLIRSP
ncbi:MAG: C1 family peptidase [Pseudomonadota bacterium]